MSQVLNNITALDFRSCAIALAVVLTSGPAFALDFTAGIVEEKLTGAERYAFMSGVAEGLAYSRYLKDGSKQTDGMACVYRWFYTDGTAKKIDEAFGKFPDYMPAPIMLAMSKEECGE